MTLVAFEDLRSDWYAANTVLPRLVVKAFRTGQPLTLSDFPSVWIPVFVHYGLEFRTPQVPKSYVPLFSDLTPSEIAEIAWAAKNRGASRSLMEAVAALDPVIADFIYIVDHKLAASGLSDPGVGSTNLLNTWHSFSRPEIVHLQERMCRHRVVGDVFLMLPCSRHRPYGDSRTHRRLKRALAELGIEDSRTEQVVVTSLGVVPEQYWQEPLVMSYDAGAVDLWRVFQLLRVFFTTNRARTVVDCLSFKPYSNMLRLLREVDVIPDTSRPIRIRWRAFHINLS